MLNDNDRAPRSRSGHPGPPSGHASDPVGDCPWGRCSPVALMGSWAPTPTLHPATSGPPPSGWSSSTAPWAPTSSWPELTADDFGGPELEGCNELLVVTRPDVVDRVHRSFYEVGCDVVETDTFGAFAPVLAEYGQADRVRELNLAAAALARRCGRRLLHPRPAPVGGREHRPGHQVPHARPDPLRRPPRRLRGAGLGAHRGRRGPHPHRDGVRPAAGQGGHQRGQAGDAIGGPRGCPSRPR